MVPHLSHSDLADVSKHVELGGEEWTQSVVTVWSRTQTRAIRDRECREVVEGEDSSSDIMTLTSPSVDVPSPAQDLVIHQERDESCGGGALLQEVLCAGAHLCTLSFRTELYRRRILSHCRVPGIWVQAHSAPGTSTWARKREKNSTNQKKRKTTAIPEELEGSQQHRKQEEEEGSTKNVESRPVVKPKVTTDFLEAAVREGADELMLRREQESMLRTIIHTSNVGDDRWRRQLVNVDGHAICRAIFQGVGGSEWETMCHKYKE